MSGYPYGHGQWPPSQHQQPPQQAPQHQHFPQYDYHPSSNPPAAYSNSPYQAPPQSQPPPNYYGAVQASHAAYEHNAQVSGLGIAMEVQGERSPNAVGGDLSWSEAFPTAAASASSSVYPPYNAASQPPYPQQQQYQHQYPSQPAPPPQVPQRVVYSPPVFQSSSNTNHAYNLEAAIIPHEGGPDEGEVSEDMDDPYEPEETSGSTGNGDVTASHSPTSRGVPNDDFPRVAMGQAAADLPSRDVSVIDTQDDAFYDEDGDEEQGEIKSNDNGASAPTAATDTDDEDMGYSDSEPKTTPVVGEERAGSYSPRLSPGEIEEGEDATGVSQPGASVVAATIATSTEAVNGRDVSSGGAGKASRGRSVAPVEEPGSPASKLPYASVDDAKKEAQRAILRLIPYGVNYQTFIDEGIDEKLIKPLFSELGLKAAPTDSTPLPRSASPTQPSEPAAPQPEPASDGGAHKEERKDRIARLLALKASKPAPAPVAKVPAAALPAKPEKAKSEKAILLQQRLEALKQAQEQRAAAATKAAAEATALGDTVPENQSQVAAAIVENIADKAAAISVVLSPAPPVNPRQRPVAADFASFSPGAVMQSSHNPLKRPYDLTRQGSSMVIEVSDDSADEDVAMEIDSQADESASRTAETIVPPGGRAPLYRDDPYNNRNGSNHIYKHYPQIDGPVSSPRLSQGGRAPPMMPAPPTAPASMLARAKDDEYTRKMREIDLMKRKIAEAEAKKARASSTGSRTPQTSGQQTPPDHTNNTNSSSVSSNDPSSLVVRPPPQPLRRIMSTGELSKEEGTSSPLALSEASLARLPKRTDVPSPSSSHESHREKRMRVASLQLPRVEANLQEKMFKLRLLQDKVAALQAEIDAGVAEKRRLTEDIENPVNGRQEENSERETNVEPPPPQAQANEATLAEVVQKKEAASPGAHLRGGDGQTVAKEWAVDVGSGAEEADKAVVEAAADATQLDLGSGGEVSQVDDSESVAGSVAISDASSSYEPVSGVDDDGDIEMVDDEAGEEEEEEDASEEGEADEADDDGVVDELFHNEVQPQRQIQRVVPAAKPASTGVKAGTLSSVFVPYESPLQYFRSYRYHPQYKARVPGGYRSLTYSGKIQDDIALCPTEMVGETCLDPACPFQHFATIVPKDDYAGDQKSRFVDGLTNLLKKIRDNKERDFDRIAESIVDFRRSFLGDDTRVLSHLEGVTV
ncbi:hypothetical protein SEUCBS140593_007444 [Sporothrix eucalyptigena]|uniref:Putative zinc-finger domain-containing protein n=1 Tax=Sporothrix eucalyptigena TaxID=1812306 RepID=A0ABP0CEI6_9PEZI